ncbi:MAG: hypothetical protein H6R10_2526 [Rhodocyclaceae bacterium]|nr:hypothetical protein [Rhodocyclaceae bacterium]
MFPPPKASSWKATGSRMNRRAAGFTLVEMIVAMVIMGIIAAVIGMILKPPIDSYVASKNRAYLASTAEGAISLITRDIRSALPNSVRMPAKGATHCIEMLPTNGGGRYRADRLIDGTKGNPIDFATETSQFDVLAGDIAKASAGDLVAIYNLGIPDADAYRQDNTAAIAALSGTSLIKLSAPKKFPVDSPAQRFFTLPANSSVYLCLNAGTASGKGAGTLFQYPNALAATFDECPTAAPANAVVVASQVSACAFSYAPGVNARTGIVTMTLGLTNSDETIQLYREAHVSNAP